MESQITQVMVVEDNEAFRSSLSHMLLQNFPVMNIVYAGSAEEAYGLLPMVNPQIVITDVRLPGRSGLDLAADIKALAADTVVIVLTSFDLMEYRLKAIENGADHFLTKDTPADDILKLMYEVLPAAHVRNTIQGSNAKITPESRD